MYAVEKLSSYITRGVYTVSGPFHPFGGAVDIIVVQQQDGSFKSSPWYVRFGKFQGVLKSKEKVVNICVNGAEAGFHMYLDHKGEAYFLKDPKTEEGVFAMSPPSSGDEVDANIQSPRFKKIQSCNIDSSDQSESGTRMDMGNGKVITRASSKRSGILSLMFGRRSMKGNINDPNVHRASSLERAEIAADLLETRWSTNLPKSDKQMNGSSERDGKDITLSRVEGGPETPHLNEEGHCDESDHTISSRGLDIDENFRSSISIKEQDEEVTVHSSPNLESGEEVIDVGASDIGNLTSRIEFTTDDATPGIGGSDATLKKSTLQDVGDASSVSGMNTEESVGIHGDELSDSHGTNLVTEVLFEERITRTILVRTNEDDPETSSLETNNFCRSNELIFESVTTESERYDVSPRESVFKSITCNGQRPGLAEASLGSYSSEHALNDRDRSSTCKFESGEKEVIPFSFSGRMESFNVSIHRAHEGPNLASGSDEQIVHNYEVISETTELISEVKSQPESGVHTDKENLDGCQDRNLEDNTIEDSSISEDTKRNGCSADSPPIAGIGQMFTSRSSPKANLINSETEVIYQEKEAYELSQGREISLEPVEASGNQTQMNGVGSAGPTNIPTHGFNDKSESKSICSFPDSVNSNNQVQEGLEVEECLLGGDNVAQEVVVISMPLGTDKANVPSSESSEDEQFMFGCIDNIVAEGIDPDQLVKDVTTGTDVHSLLTAEDDVEEHEMKDTNDEQSFQSFSEVSGTETSPVTIPRSHTHLTDSDFFISSLPIIRSHIHDLERMDLPHPLSHSLDLRSENIKQDFVQKETYGSLNLESNSDSFILQERPMSENAGTAVNDRNWGESKGVRISPAVELSLCKHLLFERMGSEAASQAFNSEKVNVEKFSTLGPSIVKNERLVVRIGGHYFPWAAAAPIILGMASFGQEDIFEPLGMIAVDRADENHKGDATRAIVKSGGSWRLWPFTFRKSKTITTVQSAPERSIRADLDTASTDMKELVGSTEKQRKKVPSLTPSSEEIASLNLREGPNVVTFTFSTAMLGRQQVDARIYLWKWNTRIVVSDVDGTITKSDVLGQFMPLVGIDWSQTGVAHLFTAIKENGYQLLFLSARAISQAYLTRQFLFNLKQDGKVLPDGPVVISPDGLFPSLYREVIRRAPHEFKISCLEDIRALFPPDCNPFYAGFGNRHTDEISYLKVGIPKGKIFIINPKGEVAVNRRIDTKSYTSLHELVNGMFPSASSAEQEDFNSWNFWKLPLPDVDI